MREGSTLIPEFLPDTGGCLFEQPLSLPKGSDRETLILFGRLVCVTIAFDFFLDNILICAFAMVVALRWVKVSAGLVACLIIHREVPTILIAPAALGLLLYQSALLTKHWTHLLTATCSPSVARDARDRLGRSLVWSFLLFPLSLSWGALCLISEGDEVWRAWVSYLNYGRDGVRAPGAFKSPAGDRDFRVYILYIVGAAVTLSFGTMPVPFFGIDSPDRATVLILSCLCAAPALMTFIVPALILAPYLGNLRRITNGAHL